MLFLAPPDHPILWNEEGMVGAKRFLKRYASMIETLVEAGARADLSGDGPALGEVSDYDKPYFRKVHQTLRKVTHDLEGMEFNTATAAMMEMLNTFSDFDPAKSEMKDWVVGVLPRLIAPFAPHLAEELLSRAGGEPSVFTHPWPTFDEAACREDSVKIPVQIKGKLRGVIEVPRGTTQDAALEAAMADENVARHVPDPAALRKVVFVPDKILNLIP